MEITNELKDLANKTPKGLIKTHFFKYAKKKYGKTKLQMDKFYSNYDKAIKFYKKENILEKCLAINSLIIGGSATAFFSLLTVEQYLERNTLVGAGLLLLTGGSLILSLEAIDRITTKKEKYRLDRENKYISKESIDNNIAYEYSKFKELVLEKNKKRK